MSGLEIGSVRLLDYEAMERLAEALATFADSVESVEEDAAAEAVIAAALDLMPDRATFAAAVVLLKILGSLLFEIGPEHWPARTRGELERARAFMLAHQDYYGELADDLVRSLGGERSSWQEWVESERILRS